MCFFTISTAGCIYFCYESAIGVAKCIDYKFAFFDFVLFFIKELVAYGTFVVCFHTIFGAGCFYFCYEITIGVAKCINEIPMIIVVTIGTAINGVTLCRTSGSYDCTLGAVSMFAETFLNELNGVNHTTLVTGSTR